MLSIAVCSAAIAAEWRAAAPIRPHTSQKGLAAVATPLVEGDRRAVRRLGSGD